MSNVPTNLIPSTITQLPEYAGSSTLGYLPYALNGRTYKVQFANIAAVGAVPSTRTIGTGDGLQGGGDLSQDRVISIIPHGVGYSQLDFTGVTAGTYGAADTIPVITVDATGRVTTVVNTPISTANYVPSSRTVTAGAGLTGGGQLNNNITIALNPSNATPQSLGVASAGTGAQAARDDHVHPAVNLTNTSETQGVLPLGRGGTGVALSPVVGAVIYASGGSLNQTTAGNAGQVLTSAGGLGAPYWQTISGVGTVTSIDVSGGTTGLTTTGGPVTAAGTITLGGTLNVANGGTGQTTYTDGQLLIGNTATSGLSKATLTAGSGISITNGAGAITIAAMGASGTVTSVDASGGTTGLTFSGGPITSSGTLTLGGTLGVANGGTGAATFTSNALLKGNGTSAVSASNISDDGTVVTITKPTNFTSQGSAPATPASGLTLYANSSNALTWKGANGFTRTFDGTANTADRTYTLPNASGTLALTSGLSSYLPLSGGTLTGQLTLASGTTSIASLNIPVGVAPTTPAQGDIWSPTASTLLMRLNASSRTFVFAEQTTTFSGAVTVTNNFTTSGAITTIQSGTTTVGNFTGATTVAVANGVTTTGNTKTVNIGTGGASGSTTNITLGSSTSGATQTTTVNGQVTLAPIGGSAAAWTASGIALKQSAATWTDTTSSGTVSAVVMNAFGAQTVAASNAITVTSLYGTYFTNPVAGTNVTATNRYALGADTLYVNSTTVIAGNLSVSGSTTLGGSIFANNAGSLNFGISVTATHTHNYSTGTTASGNTKTVNIGIGGASGSTTNITIGSSTSGATSTNTINGQVALAPIGNSLPAWTTSGVALTQSAATWTDTTSTGTVADVRVNNFTAQTVAASNVITISNLYGTYFAAPLAGTNVTTSNRWAFGADNLFVAGDVTLSATTQAISLGNSQTSGVITIGGTSATGNIVLGRSTGTQTTNIQAGTTASGSTKTVNIGTGGASGSTTAVTIGSSTSGATSTITLNGGVKPLTAAVTSSATITPTADTTNQYNVTALATGGTFAAPSGTPVDGQKLMLRIKDNGTSQTLAWNAIYRVIGTTLPTATTANKTIYVGCVYNSADSKWDVVAVSTEA